jgi:hypothetical protein
VKYDIKIGDIIEHADGSATIAFEMNFESMKVFAAIGLLKVLEDNAKDVIDGCADTKGAGDKGEGEAGDRDVREEFPGF